MFGTSSVADLINQGVAALMLLVFVLGHKRVWVFGWVYDAKCRETEKWERIANRWERIATKGLDTVEKAVEGP